jgi:hypothetical protein
VPGVAVLIWMFLVENYEVFEPEPELDQVDRTYAPPERDRASGVWLGDSLLARFRRYSLAFVIGAALAFGLLPDSALFGASAIAAPVERPLGRDTLLIDGDRGGLAVAFGHQQHIDKLGDKDSCVLCHHMVVPRDKDTPCWCCHRDMWSATDIFHHDDHALELERAGAGDPCAACHPDRDQAKSAARTPGCAADGCHRGELAIERKGTRVSLDNPERPRQAAGYMDAMHGLCIDCHREKSVELGRPRHAECATCHDRGWSLG